jgi:hypothetical protein
VRGGIRDDRVADLPGTALAARPQSRGPTGRGELAQQRVANPLELLRRCHPRFRRAQTARLVEGLEVADVARQLRLETADLAAELAARRELVDLQPRVVELELRGEVLERGLGGVLALLLELADRWGRGGEFGEGGGDVREDRELARIHTGGTGRLDRVGDDPLDLRGTGHILGDEAPGAVPGDQEAVILEPGVDPTHGVHVHARPVGHHPHARHPLARPQPPRRNQRAQAPGELNAHWEVIGGVSGEGRYGALCHQCTH